MGCNTARWLLRRDAVLTVIVTTESGSVYEIESTRVRRVNPDATKRGDGDWQELLTMFPKTPTVGHPMLLVMKSLAHLGQDDYGTPRELASGETTRRTTPVVEVSGSTGQESSSKGQLSDE